MGRFVNLDVQAIVAAGHRDRLEAFVDAEIWQSWVRDSGQRGLGEEARFDSTVAPWYSGDPYPAPAAKVALTEWWLERYLALQIRESERIIAAQAIVVDDFGV